MVVAGPSESGQVDALEDEREYPFFAITLLKGGSLSGPSANRSRVEAIVHIASVIKLASRIEHPYTFYSNARFIFCAKYALYADAGASVAAR